MPVQQPVQRAMTFFRAAPSSTPMTSLLLYTRKWSLMNRSWTTSAAVWSGQAETTAVGTCRATSSAWEGPERTTTGHLSSVTSRMIWVMRREVPFSMPLETDTRMASGASRSFTCPAVDRTPKEGVAMTTTAQPVTQARSEV